MAKITGIVAQKRKGRVNVFVDGSFGFSVSKTALSDLNLYKGRELSSREIAEIKTEDDILKCLDKAYRLLSFRPRSEEEMAGRLSEKFGPKTTEAALKKLKKKGYIDDRKFVRFWIENRKKDRGPRALRSELIQKKVSRELIDEALRELEPELFFESAKRLAESKPGARSLSKKEAYKKIAPYLDRRGYSWEVIKKVINDLY